MAALSGRKLVKTMSEFINDRFSVLDHNYMNTGGGCMTSVFSVYDKTARAMRYLVANDEGYNWQSMDTVGHEPPTDIDYDEVVLECNDWDKLYGEYAKHEDCDMYKLIKYCQFEFIRRNYTYTGELAELLVRDVPKELYDTIDAKQLAWHIENQQYICTNGYNLLPNSLCPSPEELEDDELKAIKNFKWWLDNLVNEGFATDTIENYYGDKFTIVFRDHALHLDFDAAAYQSISDALKYIIEQW